MQTQCRDLTFALVLVTALMLQVPTESRADLAPAQATGKVTLLRVHDLGTKFRDLVFDDLVRAGIGLHSDHDQWWAERCLRGPVDGRRGDR